MHACLYMLSPAATCTPPEKGGGHVSRREASSEREAPLSPFVEARFDLRKKRGRAWKNMSMAMRAEKAFLCFCFCCCYMYIRLAGRHGEWSSDGLSRILYDGKPVFDKGSRSWRGKGLRWKLPLGARGRSEIWETPAAYGAHDRLGRSRTLANNCKVRGEEEECKKMYGSS